MSKGHRFKILFLLCSSSLLVSCFSQKKEDINATFEKRFGQEVEKIKAERGADPDAEKINRMQSSVEEIAKVSKDENKFYSYVDVNKFNEKAPETYLPNGESYEQAKNRGPANTVPPDLFEITYNLGLYPPFRYVGAEFDAINVPSQDVYGVKTEMSEKPYLLAGNNALQKSIDQINAEKTAADIENSKVIIREQKQIRRERRMAKTFGESEMALLEKSGSEEDKK